MAATAIVRGPGAAVRRARLLAAGQGEALDPGGIVAQATRMIDRYGFTAIKLKRAACSRQSRRWRQPAP
jgi:hypothetical protein